MLKGRLGLDSANVPHADRAGCLYLARGTLTTRDGTLAFLQGDNTAADALDPGVVNWACSSISMTGKSSELICRIGTAAHGAQATSIVKFLPARLLPTGFSHRDFSLNCKAFALLL